ncbi:UDP-glucose--hexose-1-phosphate uridylyltransferase [Metabacillus arenae]|uniref:Galactose-1-phosphate uridylyltransferase n=1 Tax=Metabacillus arenae TaxID=2771434 RepID=A0A926NFA6_9BACI|nr:UDP-glucose--hexose-1-phosphate uridylyltransferase [Metabacillus arenae]MBD1379755.1 UDP-glucose--hexose-1-phosphate uridylyltransferase [Metabacillus arenae]
MLKKISTQIERLLQYGMQKELIMEWDIDLTRNKLMEILNLDDFYPIQVPQERLDTPVEILEEILDWAAENDLLEENTVTYRDLLDTKLMACFVPSQTEMIRWFDTLKKTNGAEAATKAFYDYSKGVHYIRTDRIAKNQHWYSQTLYGLMEITINLSKPEKDPKAIAAAKNLKQANYPNCLLCKENVGYRGRVNHPARQNHRIIPVTLKEEQWFLQFSPYVYYNEHCIVLKGKHEPMSITKETFERLLDFVEQYPHYFLGSNADLPIVGGSILSHDHFQGGNHEFPMAKAGIEQSFELSNFPKVSAGIVKWPMSVIRLQSHDKQEVLHAADYILNAWRAYSDQRIGVFAFTGETPHNTITPIARMRERVFELDLVLRNNRTSEEHPLGIFHPHQEVHHIKKENIGLIEVMGLAVLPGRLIEEMNLVAKALVSQDFEKQMEDNQEITKHLDWARKIKDSHQLTPENSLNVLKEEMGNVFAEILGHAGVFKQDEEGQGAFRDFMMTL